MILHIVLFGVEAAEGRKAPDRVFVAKEGYRRSLSNVHSVLLSHHYTLMDIDHVLSSQKILRSGRKAL